MKGAQALATSLHPLSGCQQSSCLTVDRPDGVLGSLKRLEGEMLYFLPVSLRCPQTPRSLHISPGRLVAKQSCRLYPRDVHANRALVCSHRSHCTPPGLSNLTLSGAKTTSKSSFSFALTATENGHGKHLLAFIKCQPLF